MSQEADSIVTAAIQNWHDEGFQETAYSTQDYILAVGMPVDVGVEEFPRLTYNVINRRFGVIESSGSSLAAQVATMHELQRQLVQMGLSTWTEDRPETLNS